MNKFIITGGPGSGKTSLIKQLELQGYSCSPEASRQLIIEQVALQSNFLPWLNLPAFADLALQRMMELYHEAQQSPVTFFDRGIPDIIGYLEFAAQPVPERYFQTLNECIYNQIVFILPPWKDIYINDSERWQSFDESVLIYQALKDTYTKLNFTLIEVPRMPVEGRAAFIFEHITHF